MRPRSPAALTTGGLSAQSGIATGATVSGGPGSISITNQAPTLLQIGAINTWGPIGAAGGDVSLSSAGNVTSGAITAYGGALNAGTAAAGRAGGSVTIEGVDRNIAGVTAFGAAGSGLRLRRRRRRHRRAHGKRRHGEHGGPAQRPCGHLDLHRRSGGPGSGCRGRRRPRRRNDREPRRDLGHGHRQRRPAAPSSPRPRAARCRSPARSVPSAAPATRAVPAARAGR